MSHSENIGREAVRVRDIPKAGWKQILSRVKSEVGNDNLNVIAAGVAFYFLLGLFPGIAAVISIYGMVLDPATLQDQISQLAILPAEARDIILQQFERSAETGALSWGAALGLLLALWSGARGTKAIIIALNVAYEESERRNFIKFNGLALLFTLGLVLVGVIAMAAIVVLPNVLQAVGIGGGLKVLIQALTWPALLLVFMGVLSVLYAYAPHRRAPKWRWVTVGSATATVVWIIASILFSWYAAQFGSYNKTYGAVGAVVILMMWFYITAYAILLGAELNAEMEHQTEMDTTHGKDRPIGKRGAWVADHVPSS